MAAPHFFPRRLDPVLDSGEGDEGTVVTPQVPAGVAVGHPVLGDEADGHALDAERVEALGQGQGGEVGGEAAAAGGAAVARERDGQIDGASIARVAEIVEGAGGQRVASCSARATRARAGEGDSAALLDACLGKVFDAGDAFGHIRDVLAWPAHRPPS
jgi:hypothetical protein